MEEKENNSCYASCLLDVIRGYSILEYEDKVYYFKHFKIVDLLEFDHLQQKDIKQAIKSGIKTEKTLLDSSIKIGSWSTQKEESIKTQGWMLKKSITALAKIKDPAQRKIFNNQIESQERDLSELKEQRNKIVSYSAEHLSEIKKIKRMTGRSVFVDLKFSETFPEEDASMLASLLFAKNSQLGNRNNLLNASYFGGFFDLFATQGISPLINKTFEEMTVLQKNLLVLSNSLLNKIKRVEIPDEFMGDPVKIMDYEEKQDGETKTSHGVDDLKMKMKARGGKLKAEDFLS